MSKNRTPKTIVTIVDERIVVKIIDRGSFFCVNWNIDNYGESSAPFDTIEQARAFDKGLRYAVQDVVENDRKEALKRKATA